MFSVLSLSLSFHFYQFVISVISSELTKPYAAPLKVVPEMEVRPPACWFDSLTIELTEIDTDHHAVVAQGWLRSHRLIYQRARAAGKESETRRLQALLKFVFPWAAFSELQSPLLFLAACMYHVALISRCTRHIFFRNTGSFCEKRKCILLNATCKCKRCNIYDVRVCVWSISTWYAFQFQLFPSISPALTYPGNPSIPSGRIGCRRWFTYFERRTTIFLICGARGADRLLLLWTPWVVVLINVVLCWLFVIYKVDEQVHEYRQYPPCNDDTNNSQRT